MGQFFTWLSHAFHIKASIGLPFLHTVAKSGRQYRGIFQQDLENCLFHPIFLAAGFVLRRKLHPKRQASNAKPFSSHAPLILKIHEKNPPLWLYLMTLILFEKKKKKNNTTTCGKATNQRQVWPEKVQSFCLALMGTLVARARLQSYADLLPWASGALLQRWWNMPMPHSPKNWTEDEQREAKREGNSGCWEHSEEVATFLLITGTVCSMTLCYSYS